MLKVFELDPGFLCGFGLFETMRAYKNKIVYLDAHLKRIQESSRPLRLRCPPRVKLKKIIQKAIKVNGFTDAYVRLTLWKAVKGTGISVIVKKHIPYSSRKYQTGIKVMVSGLRQNENSFLSNIKTTSRLLYELSYQEAKEKGFEESIILNSRGYLAEGSRSNVFLVQGNALFTPSLSCGCLAGITRKVIFDLAKKHGIKICEGNFTLGDAYQADEMFLTNSLAGAMPVASINNKIIGKGRCGRLTGFLIKKYRCLLK